MINNKVPKRRFKGFTDDWEQRKLFDVASYRNGKAHENEIDENGKYIVVNSKFVSTDGKIKKYSNKQNEPLLKNEVVFVLSDVPNGRAIAKAFIIDKSDKYTLNQRIAGITPNDGINSKYLAITMNRNKYFLQFDDGIKQTNLSLEDMKKYENYYPTKLEQDKIGLYFSELDNLITLHQRKLKKLVDLKSSYLEKMFPEGNKNIPKLRFKNFNNTEVWNVKSLKELGYTYNSLSGMTKEDFDNGTSKYITYLNVFHNSITRINELEKVRVNKKQNKVLNGDVFFTTSSETPEEVGMSSVWTHDLDDVYLNSFCFGYRFYDKFSPYFTANLFRSNGFRKEIELLAQGISRFNISKQRVMDLSISYPSVNEQKTIGNFFSKLDNIIKLQNKKLNKLKDLKQAYLNEMFVN